MSFEVTGVDRPPLRSDEPSGGGYMDDDGPRERRTPSTPRDGVKTETDSTATVRFSENALSSVDPYGT